MYAISQLLNPCNYIMEFFVKEAATVPEFDCFVLFFHFPFKYAVFLWLFVKLEFFRGTFSSDARLHCLLVGFYMQF